MHVYGLLITKDDHEVFGDWCRDQLALYEHVICLDGSDSDATEREARHFSDRLTYLHERDFDIPCKSDHGLRRVVHHEITRRFGNDVWIMCCHTDEFCYHDPGKAAALAERGGYDLVSWFSPHFYPHPSELSDLEERLQRPVQSRFRHYQWGYLGTNVPWIEDRLYHSTAAVEWDTTTHGSVRPHGLSRPAQFHPIYRHFKVCGIDLASFELDQGSSRYRGHWETQENRTGMPFRVERLEDFFVTSVPHYSFCDRFNGRFDHPWNIGDEFRPDALAVVPSDWKPPSPKSARTVVLPSGNRSSSDRPVIAFGPRMPEFGSWNWVGGDIADELSSEFDVRTFENEVPHCDLVVFVKVKPAVDVLRRISKVSAIIYCPIDIYGSSGEIDADAEALATCDRVLVHCDRLRKYFTAYTAVEYIDHHVKFASPLRKEFLPDGPILWVGVRSNLPPLVNWVNRQHLPEELWVLTNPEDPAHTPQARQLGFQPHNSVRVERWSAERQRELTALSRSAFDIKGDDFRARHKPPVKAIDYLASGVPLALQRDSSPAEHLKGLGFDVAEVGDWDRWLSPEYWMETSRFGAGLREGLSRDRVGQKWHRILSDVLAGRERIVCSENRAVNNRQ